MSSVVNDVQDIGVKWNLSKLEDLCIDCFWVLYACTPGVNLQNIL